MQTIAALNRLIKIGFYTLLRNGQLKEYRRKRQADAHILIAAATTTAAPSSITYIIYIVRVCGCIGETGSGQVEVANWL